MRVAGATESSRCGASDGRHSGKGHIRTERFCARTSALPRHCPGEHFPAFPFRLSFSLRLRWPLPLARPQAVRSGDLRAFGEVLSRHRGEFQKDETYGLLTRLHQNVIRAGLRIICLSYSKIPLVRL